MTALPGGKGGWKETDRGRSGQQARGALRADIQLHYSFFAGRGHWIGHGSRMVGDEGHTQGA